MDKPLSDDLLVAYADDRLDPATRARVEDHLASDPAARQLVADLREAHGLLADGLGPVEDEPVPDWLVEAVQRIPPPQSPASTVIPLRPRPAWSHWPLSPAMAALLALGMGLVAGWFGNAHLGPSAPTTATVTATGENLLQQALEQRISGDPLRVSLADVQLEVQPLLSFRDDQGRICREFERRAHRNGLLDDQLGVACRDDTGQWVTEVLVSRSLLEPAGDDDGFYAPVAGDQATGPFEALSEQLMGSTPLAPDEEAALIQQGWAP